MPRSSTTNGHRVKTVGEAWTLVHAATTDHTNRLMRKAGRSVWNVEDRDACVADLYRRLTAWGFWRNDQPTELYFDFQVDRNAPFVIADTVQVSA